MTSEQVDVSIKLLLKQVYAAHITKIKGLDEEIGTLKSKLHEADRKIKQGEIECKRCAELEEAFKSCKSALHEQSKWIENLGQKFSVSDNSGNDALSKNGTSLTLEDTGAQSDVAMNSQLANNSSEKSAYQQNLLKNLMTFNSDENQESLNLYSVPFPQQLVHDYSTLNSDSLILAPDTVDITSDANPKNNNINRKPSPLSKTKKASAEMSDETVITNETGCKKSSRPTKKRPNTESFESNKVSKKLSINSSLDANIVKPIVKQKSDFKSIDSPLHQEMITQNSIKVTPTNNLMKNSKEKAKVKNLNLQKSKDDFISLVKKSDNAIDTTSNNKKKTSLDAEISKGENVVQHTNNLQPEIKSNTKANMETKVALNNSEYQISPSLLPLNKNSKPEEQGFVAEDISDFQSPVLNKKQVTGHGHKVDDGTWTACDKKKLKKRPPVTILKSTSKFKMHLDALPPNYKKPTFRQTKLSKSIFQPKASTSTNETKPVEVIEDCISSSSDEENDPISLPMQRTVKTGIVDFDATCIPDNYEIIASGHATKEKISKENVDNGANHVDTDIINESSNGSSSSSPLCRKILNQSIEKSDSNDADIFEDFNPKRKREGNSDFLNSFDRLPKKEEPNYKYKEETVRKKAERKQLNGFDCKECENYYSDLGLTDKEKQERLKNCSRHRAKFAPPATPEHFWELEFPDTQECKARGYLNETQKVKLKSHRRRPLDL